MNTYYLGNEEVESYVRELVGRLAKCNPRPSIWCPLTDSGRALLEVLTKIVKNEMPELIPGVTVIGIEVDSNGSPLFKPGDIEQIAGKDIFIFDSAVHSGGTMLRTVQALRDHGAKDICSYALVLKQGSEFIPSLWGAMIDDYDRAYFQLAKTPNNRLTTHSNEQHPFSCLRKLEQRDVEGSMIISGVASMDRTTWGDRHFNMQSSGGKKCTYLLETTRGIAGYLTIEISREAFHVDEIAVDKSAQGRGYGGVLLRFAETLTRRHGCRCIQLHAISSRADWYKKFGFQAVPGFAPVRLDKLEEYVLMEKRLVHHVPPMDD